MSSLTRKTLRNSLYNLAAFIWPLVLAFFATPYVVKHIGPENYGILALVTSFIGFLAFLDLGISPSLVKYTSEYFAKKDYLSLNRLFSSALLFYTLMGLLSGLLIVIFAWFWAPSFIKVSAHNTETVRVIFLVAAVGFFINMILTAFSAIPGSIQRFDIASRLNLVAATVATGLTILAVSLGYGVITLAIVGIIISFGALVAYGFINKRLIPSLRYRLGFHKDMVRKIFVFGGYAFISSLAGTVLFQLDKFILGAQLGATAVAFYVLPGNLAIKIHSLVATVTNVVFPLSSELITTGDTERLHNLYLRSSRIILTLVVLGVTPLLILANKFLLFWVGPEFAANSTIVLQVLLLTYSILAMTAIPFYIAYGAGKPKYAALFSLASGALNVLLIFLLVPRYGINGAAYAYLIAVLPGLWFVRFTEKRILHISTGEFYKQTTMRLLFLAATSCALSFLLLPHISSLKAVVLVYGAVTALSAGAFYLMGFFEPKDLELLPFLKRNSK